MPLQNRVAPSGEIFASTARGTFMGNRGGAIHNVRREIVRRRTVISPGRYTELFFLDEAVALAAGHRPCAECRRERFNAFKTAWNRLAGGKPPLADEIDLELHAKRIHQRAEKVTFQVSLESLPDGCFVQIEGCSYLLLGGALVLWSPAGYVEKRHRPTGLVVAVLTPEPIVRCIREGYRPEIHGSAWAIAVAEAGAASRAAVNRPFKVAQ